MKNILVVLGTRPEAIKLAPVILELSKYPDLFKVIVCNTEQQKELSNQALSFFGIKADINLDAMSHNQSLAGLQSTVLTKLNEVFLNNEIHATIVQGDTMSVFCGGLASFYNKIPVFHVEAGLRSGNIFEPFPEEAIRCMVSKITDLHFAPTNDAAEVLVKEGIVRDKVISTGNTVIDALMCLSQKAMYDAKIYLENQKIVLDDKITLITVHRRENHGERLDNILKAITTIVERKPDHKFILPVHPNPNVKDKVHQALGKFDNVHLLPPLDYPVLVTLMRNTKLVLTDSGGIQEEAPSFGNPVLVMRYKTERNEGVAAGFAKLVGADTDMIVKESLNILDKNKAATRLDGSKNPYGNGMASKTIVAQIKKFLQIDGELIEREEIREVAVAAE